MKYAECTYVEILGAECQGSKLYMPKYIELKEAISA